MQAVAKLKNLPISPRKVRLVADLLRGVSVNQGLAILKHTSKKCAIHLEKLLLSAISNWEQRHGYDNDLEEIGLAVKEIWVDNAGMLKRIKAAPQGRAHRIRKRSSHITLIVGARKSLEQYAEAPESAEVAVATDMPKVDTVAPSELPTLETSETISPATEGIPEGNETMGQGDTKESTHTNTNTQNNGTKS